MERSLYLAQENARNLFEANIHSRNLFSLEREGSTLILRISAELDHHLADQVSRTVDIQIENGTLKTLIFDFTGMTFMDSSGIGMVMGRYRKMNFLGGMTYVTGIGEGVDRIFSMSGLYRIIPRLDIEKREEK